MLTTDSLPVLDSLPQSIQAAIKTIPKHSHYFVALSGGLDSLALLAASYIYLKGRDVSLKAIHVNHGLSPNAEDWAEFCVAECEQLGVECIVEHVTVEQSGEGLEAAARKARYAVFERCLDDGGILLQGHHLNDQAETFLFKACKGLGPEALAGIPRERTLASGNLYRPWLNVGRDDLYAWADDIGLEWIEDESNKDARFDRNFLRNEILPVLKTRWPHVVKTLGQAADKAARSIEQKDLWQAYHLEKVLNQDRYGYEALNLECLRELPELLQRSLIRYWIETCRLVQPPEASFERIWTEVLLAPGDASPEVRWGQQRLVRFSGHLYLLPVEVESEPYEYVIAANEYNLPIELECNGYLLTIQEGKTLTNSDGEFSLDWPANLAQVRVVNRQGGERISLPSHQHSSALKSCFQQWKTPPWLRNLPLVYFDEDLAFVGIGQVAANFLPKSGARTLSISLKSLA